MYVEAFIDGASRKNEITGKRRAACAVIIYNKRKEVLRFARLLGDRDHNEAEYEALILALASLSLSEFKNPIIYCDSAVVVNQVNKKWKVKSNLLVPYFLTVNDIKSEYHFNLIQVPRSKVFIPDELCNTALDREESYYE